MAPQLNRPPHHAPVSPSPSSSTATSAQESFQGGSSSSAFVKPRFFSWRVLGGIFATMLVVGWVFIIVILIQEEKWQLVLIAWLLLYAAAHFCYWYFKRHHLLSIQSQICGRARGNVGTIRSLEKGGDAPPSYEDIIKSEAPPPAYYSVVEGSPKFSSKQGTSTGFPLFSLHGLPKVFGRGSTPSSPPSSPSTSTAPRASTSSSNSSSTNSILKKAHGGKSSSPPSHPNSSSHYPVPPPPSISGTLPPDQSCSWESSYGGRRNEPPPYSDSFVDVESQVIAPSSRMPSSPSSRATARSVSRGAAEAVMNEALRPIFSPIYKNTTTLPSPSFSSRTPCSRPPTSQTLRETAKRISVDVDVENERHFSTPVSS